jgi:tRNA U34 5-carboxymethylaminomethyl modifying GTPase MnmE/TrmE
MKNAPSFLRLLERDTIEDELVIGGIGFRFIDTAGIRETQDVVESIGIRKTFEKIEQSQVVLYLFESLKFKVQSSEYIVEIEKVKNQFPLKPLVVVINKTELLTDNEVVEIKPTRTTECDSRNDICQRKHWYRRIENKLLSLSIPVLYAIMRQSLLTQDIMTPY